MDKRTQTTFDENLRSIPVDPQGLREYTKELLQGLRSDLELRKRVSILGEAAVHLRILGDLNDAEKMLKEALEIIKNQQLGIKIEIQQELRLAHVLQDQKKFQHSDELLKSVFLFADPMPKRSLLFTLRASARW